jgi:four helix bundle protein
MYFPHDRLDAYAAAADFVVIIDSITNALPRGRAYLVDQLRRASTSVQANIAEGAGEFSAPDKARFYRMALRSASECAALLDICGRLELSEEQAVCEAKELLDRVMAMVTRLVVRFGGSGGRKPGSGSGSG